MKVAIIPNLDKQNAAKYANIVINKLQKLKIKVYMLSEFNNIFQVEDLAFCNDYEDIVDECDVIITIGGDGTIIHSAKYCARFNKPLLGINCGRMGYLAGLEIDEIDNLDKLISGDYQIDSRTMISVTICRPNGEKENFVALNDAVVSKGELSRMIDLTVQYNSKFFCNYRADGLIFSTPTGSTAYSLSAGGPIVDPATNSILLTPICAHSFFTRSVLFNENAILSVEISKKSIGNVFLTVDGEKSILIVEDDVIQIKQSRYITKLIKIKSELFYDVVTEKFSKNT